MKLQVERLSTTPSDFTYEGDAAWWLASRPSEQSWPLELAEPFRFELQAYCMGEDVYLEGRAEGLLELECGRCLARYRHPFRESYRLVLEPAGTREPADPEAAAALSRDGVCLGDELETGWFRGSEIHLGTFFQELIALSLPVQPLCREDCPGLCPRCGASREGAPCGCEDRPNPSPFAALAALRGDRAEKPS